MILSIGYIISFFILYNISLIPYIVYDWISKNGVDYDNP